MSENHEHHHHGEACACGHDHHDDGCGCGHDHSHGDEVNKKQFGIKMGVSIALFIAGYLVMSLLSCRFMFR